MHLPGRTGLQCKSAYEAIRTSGGPREEATPIGRAARSAASRAAVAIRAAKGGAAPRPASHSPNNTEGETAAGGSPLADALPSAATANIGPARNKPIVAAGPPAVGAGGESPLVGSTLRFGDGGAEGEGGGRGEDGAEGAAGGGSATVVAPLVISREQSGEADGNAVALPAPNAAASTLVVAPSIPQGQSTQGVARTADKGETQAADIHRTQGPAPPGIPAGDMPAVDRIPAGGMPAAEPPFTPRAAAHPSAGAPPSPLGQSASPDAARVLASMAGPPPVFPPAAAAPAAAPVAFAAAPRPPSSVVSKRSAPVSDPPQAHVDPAPQATQAPAFGAKRHKGEGHAAPDPSGDASMGTAADSDDDTTTDAPDSLLPPSMPPPRYRRPPRPPHTFDRQSRPADRVTVARLLAGMLQGAARPPSPPLHALLDPSPDRLCESGQPAAGMGMPADHAGGTPLTDSAAPAPVSAAGTGRKTPHAAPRPSIRLSPAQAIGVQASALAELRLQRRWLNHLFEQELSRLDTPARGQACAEPGGVGAVSLGRARQAVADKFKRLRAELLAREELQLQSMEAMQQWEASGRGRRMGVLNSAAPPPRFAVYGPPPGMPSPVSL